ncbi:MAG TPA: winged helix DNA-binding domain-containing protein [Gaiellaceae bacterium]|nr:winged helix DNA-binding domain-containing protein [Gaiellaceae bacterium]
MRTLSLRELNRALLARQFLLERRRLGVVAAVERLAGMQAQWGPAPYVGLWTRLVGFRRDALEQAILSTRLVRAVLMRGTIHLVSRRDYGIFGSAVGRPPWLKPELAALADGLHDAVVAFGSEPRTRAEVEEHMTKAHGVELEHAPALWYGLRIKGRLTHAPETGLWKPPRETRYVTLPYEPTDDVVAARAELVRRYLAAFGPATRADIAEWSGLRVGDFTDALASLEPLRRFADENGRELLDLPRAPLPPADTPAPARLLPRFDNLVLSHADRSRVVAAEHRARIVQTAEVRATFLVDGFVAGVWSLERGRVVLDPFQPIPRSAQRELAAEARLLEEWAA